MLGIPLTALLPRTFVLLEHLLVCRRDLCNGNMCDAPVLPQECCTVGALCPTIMLSCRACSPAKVTDNSHEGILRLPVRSLLRLRPDPSGPSTIDGQAMTECCAPA